MGSLRKIKLGLGAPCLNIFLTYFVVRSGVNPAIYFMCLDTMLGQMRSTGDTNLSHYSRHLAVKHGMRLSSTEMYIHLHDILAWAIQGGILTRVQRVVVTRGV